MIESKIINYRNKECIQYLKDVVSIYSAFDLTALKLKTFVDQLEARNTLLEELFEIAKKSEKTETLESIDERRDRAIVGIRKVADGFSTYFEADKETAGKLVITHIDKYGKNLYRLNYLAETTALTSVVNDLDTDTAAKAAVTLLGLTAWVAELKDANIDFNTLYLARNTDLANQPDQNLLTARLESYPVFDLLMEKTASYYSAFGNPEYKTIIDQMNEITLKYNETVPKRVAKPKTPTEDKK
jgi:hypothetical protein